MRKVTIYSTIGNEDKTVMSDATNWGTLQAELTAQHVGANGMKVVIGESQVTLESSQAELPAGDFTLFYMPQKVKSGGWGREEDDDEDNLPVANTPNTPIGRVQAKILEIGNELNELYDMVNNLPKNSDPAIAKLQEKADQLKKNLGLFD